MGRIYYITGGAYSGKSAFAENITSNYERLGIIVIGTPSRCANQKSGDKNGEEDWELGAYSDGWTLGQGTHRARL